MELITLVYWEDPSRASEYTLEQHSIRAIFPFVGDVRCIDRQQWECTVHCGTGTTQSTRAAAAPGKQSFPSISALMEVPDKRGCVCAGNSSVDSK